jgi:hypothetical protein
LTYGIDLLLTENSEAQSFLSRFHEKKLWMLSISLYLIATFVKVRFYDFFLTDVQLPMLSSLYNFDFTLAEMPFGDSRIGLLELVTVIIPLPMVITYFGYFLTDGIISKWNQVESMKEKV